MSKNIIQIAGDDGCIYIIDKDRGVLQRLSDVRIDETVPKNVVETIHAFKLPLNLAPIKELS